MVIVDNLAPLVGTTPESKRWSPYVGYTVVLGLEIAKFICINADADEFTPDGVVRYVFANKLTPNMVEAYQGMKSLDTAYLDSDRIIYWTTGDRIPDKSWMLINAHNRSLNNSAILRALEGDPAFHYCPYKAHVLLILLDAYCLRRDLFEYYLENQDLPISELRPARLVRLIENIRYTRVKLEAWDANKTASLNHHLAVLMFNAQAVKRYLSDQIIER